MQGILAFIIIFGIIVVVHEYGHFYFAKKAGILVREFAIGMGPKIFSHTGKDGTLYTIRILPLGGYVRMAGWGEDKTEIKTGTPASLALNEAGQVIRINLSQKQVDREAVPMQVTAYDLEEALTITGKVLDESRTYLVHHDATIVEEDGTEVRIAPLDVQYQNASVWGRFLTNFAGPLNNFILGILAFVLLAFLQGGVPNLETNQIQVEPASALEAAGIQSGDRLLSINGQAIEDYQDISDAVDAINASGEKNPVAMIQVQSGKETREVSVPLKRDGDRYRLGVSPGLKTGFMDKLFGGVTMAVNTAGLIVNALRGIIARFDVQQLGGPVAIYKVSAQAAEAGFLPLLELLAMLSINLGIFNLIPIPALDGGKIVINILEAIRRKPLKRETESYITLAGVVVMVLLMLVVTWNDIVRVFF